MSKKKNILAALEAYADKIIVGVIGVIGLYLLWTLVVSNPYAETIQGRRVGPGQIDAQNRREARNLEDALSRPADRLAYDIRIIDEFQQLMQSPLTRLAANIPFPYPGIGEAVLDDDRVYPVPGVVPVTDVRIAHVRGAVHKPVEEVGPNSPYQAVETELEDLDFVTVEGRIDIETLHRNFQQSFMGPRLDASWRDPSFANPVIARLELQRRQQLEDGSWSQWQRVPRPRVDPYRTLYEQTPLTTEEMEFGNVMMWLRQYKDPQVQATLLQPRAYDFASLRTSWLPPRFMEEANELVKRQEEERRRQEREARLRARQTDDRRETRTTRTRRQQTPTRDDMMTAPRTTTTAQQRTSQRRERTMDDIISDLEREQLDEQESLERRRDPLLVWAHDDTAQPGSTYQYRIRLGVFNPIAGNNWFREDQQDYKNKVVWWSNLSEPTDTVSIPRMMHLFPLEVLAEEADSGVKVDVARYYMGQWRTQEFDIFPGQIIGDLVDEYTPPSPPTAARRQPTMDGMDMWAGSRTQTMGASQELSVDFTTPYMLVDIDSRVVWHGTNRSEFSEMLYFGNEETLLTMAVGSRNWPSDKSRQYREIKDAEQNAMPLDMTRRSTPGMMRMPSGMEGMMLDDMMEMDGMMDEMY